MGFHHSGGSIFAEHGACDRGYPVGSGSWTSQLGGLQAIEAKDRCQAGVSVPGQALFLVDVTYPEELFVSEETGDQVCG